MTPAPIKAHGHDAHTKHDQGGRYDNETTRLA